jgi:archaellum biogenesis protein FlaJ (TadC family)
VKRRQQRDLLVIRRTFITVSLLFMLAFPGVILMIKRIMTSEEHPLIIRITYTFVGLFIAGLICLPQLKNIVSKIWNRNQIVPFTRSLVGEILMRNIPNNQ